MKREIKTQEEFLDHITSISNFIYNSVERGNLLDTEAIKYYDLVEQLEKIIYEKWMISAHERRMNRLRKGGYL
tara:strand:+ start:61 stop:279 length:219 start_codon:yes stop_codon:yes gene_type:complete